MHLTKVRKLIFSLGPILIFLRTLVRFPSVMAWCRFILGYMAKSVCSCFLWPLSGMHKAYKKYSHLILYRIFCKNSVCLLWQFRQICVFLSKLLSPSITFWANVICSLWRNITYWFEMYRFSTYIEHPQYHLKNPNQNATFFEKERSNDYEKHCGGSHSGGGAKPLRASNSNTKKGDRNLPTIN